jgi:O-antigen ligase
VLFLLRLDRKQSAGVSLSLWIPVSWALYIAGKPVGSWFGKITDMEAGSPLDRAYLIAILCLSILVLRKRQLNWSDAIRENKWLMVLILYMLVSVLWSPMPAISFRRWIRELTAVAMAFLVMSERNPRQALQSIFRRTIYLLIPVSLLLIKYYPDLGIYYNPYTGERSWIGAATQKNGLGLLCVVSAFFLVWTFIRRWQRQEIPVAKYQIYAEVLLLFLTFWLLGGPQKSLTYSATSTVAFLIGLAVLGGFLWAKKRGLIIGPTTLKVLVASIIVIGTLTPILGKLPIFDVSASVGRDETLTGRSDIWQILVPLAMKTPLLGHGIGGFWTTAMRERTSSHAHNGYLDMLLNLGFIGLLLFFLFFSSCCTKAHAAMLYEFEWGILFTCFLLMALIHNITESSVDSFSRYLNTIILFFSFSLSNIFRSGQQTYENQTLSYPNEGGKRGVIG